MPRPNSAPYTTTKHALTGLTRSTFLDGREQGIVCGQIDIGNAHTPMTAGMAQGVKQADSSVKAEPTMDVENVARTVLYMDSLPLDANVPFLYAWELASGSLGRTYCYQRRRVVLSVDNKVAYVWRVVALTVQDSLSLSPAGAATTSVHPRGGGGEAA